MEPDRPDTGTLHAPLTLSASYRRQADVERQASHLIAFVGWVTHKRAHDRWAELPDTDLIEVVIDEFDRLVHLFSR